MDSSFRTALLVVAVCGWMAGSLPQAVAPNERLAAIAVGKEGLVATLESGPGDWRMLFNNSYTLGGSKAQFNQERQALLPLLFHGKPKSVATLGSPREAVEMAGRRKWIPFGF
jgi:hypothetical protein